MQNSVSKAEKYLEKRFGITEDDPVMNGLMLKEVSDDIWLVTADCETEMAVKTYGIRFIRIQNIGLKPTTYALQFLDEAIKKNVVELTEDQFLSLLGREMVEEGAVEGNLESTGYVALRFEGRVFGCGLYKHGKISSRIPKGRTRELRDWMSGK